MRYSFHGKVRATGQQVDGFVEAHSSTEAIDRLADQGIIGVHTVRPEARKPKNSVILSGQEFLDEEAPPQSETPALPGPATVAMPAPHQPVILQMPTLPAGSATQEATLAQLIEKVTILIAQVEKVLAKPTQVIYQGGGGRGGEATARSKRVARNITDEQNSTLRDIFQKNLDLRRGTSSPIVPAAKQATDSAPAVEKPKPIRSESPKAAANPKSAQPPRDRATKSQPVA